MPASKSRPELTAPAGRIPPPESTVPPPPGGAWAGAGAARAGGAGSQARIRLHGGCCRSRASRALHTTGRAGY
jgi:hypothetical protein